MAALSGIEAHALTKHRPVEADENQTQNTALNTKLLDASQPDKKLPLSDAVYRTPPGAADSFLPNVDMSANPGDAKVQEARYRGHIHDGGEASVGQTDARLQQAVARAEQLKGQKLWENTPYSDIVGNGEFGCAASLGKFLNSIGERVKPSPLALGLKNNLLATGRYSASHYQGDDIPTGSVIFGTKTGRGGQIGGGASHIAYVVGKRDGVLMVADNNAKLGGRWDIRPLTESFPPERYNLNRLTVLKHK